jgi:hypothetical protein
MPPRHVYWTILVGDAPTAFRAHDRADLLPTFERLRKKQPDVVLKYFARGRLWASAEDARAAGQPPRPSEPRGREWRPGGTHKDPRDRFKKAPRGDRPTSNRSSERSARPPQKPSGGGARPPWRDDRASKPRQNDRPAQARQSDRPPERKWGVRDNRAPRSDRAPREERRPGDKWQPRGEWRPKEGQRAGDDRRPADKRQPRGEWRPKDGQRSGEHRSKESRAPWKNAGATADRGPRPKTGWTDRPWKPKPFTPGRNPTSRGPAGPVKDRPLPEHPPDDRPKDRPDERVEARRKEGTRLIKKVRR